MGADLSLIPGMRDRHRQVLAKELHATTAHGLVLADRQAIIAAFKKAGMRRPTLPTLEEVAEWQDHARKLRAEGMTDSSGWDRYATFVVSFEERGSGRGRQRQLVVEQTELEPEEPPHLWQGWDCTQLCQWMTSELDLTKADRATATTASPPDTSEGRQPAKKSAAAQSVHVDQLAVVGPTTRVDLSTDMLERSPSPRVCSLPCRLTVAVAGSDPDQDFEVLVRFHRPNQSGWSPFAPVTRRGRSQAEFDLAVVGPGRYDATVVAWVPDGSAQPHVVKLPPLIVETSIS